MYWRPPQFLETSLSIVDGSGATLVDSSGKEYVDLCAGFGSVSFGHNNTIVRAGLERAVAQVWNPGHYTTALQEEAVAGVDALLPKELRLAALHNGGAEAVEHGLRLGRLATGKTRYLSFREHFHGKSHGTMFLLESYPECYGSRPADYQRSVSLDEGEDSLAESLEASYTADLAGIVCEAVVGYSGPYALAPGTLRTIREFCDRHELVMIVDEVFSGLYRCGADFVCVAEGIVPDVLCFGKALGNGFPVSAVATTERLGAFLDGSVVRNTFAGNPLACGAVNGVLAVIEPEFGAKALQIEERVQSFVAEDGNLAGVDVRGRGALLSLNFPDSSAINVGVIARECVGQGVIVTHTENRLRLTPPLVISSDELGLGLEGIALAVKTICG